MIRASVVLLDTCACIHYLDRAHPARHDAVASLVKESERRHRRLLVSTVTIAEALTGAIRAGRDAEGRALVFLTRVCAPVAPTVDIASRAARLRVEHGLKTPDALIVATAQLRAGAVIGNDKAWRRIDELNYVHIDDLVSAGG